MSNHDLKLKRVKEAIKKDPSIEEEIVAVSAPSFDERKKILDELRTQHFPSKFSFLNDAHGLRKGEVTLVLGHKGHGKSTLNKAILGECVDNKKTCLVYLSEEKARIYLGTAFSGWGRERDEDIATYIKGIGENDKLSMIKVEDKDTAIKFKKALVHIEYNIEKFDAKVLIFDNISTSSVYSENDKEAVASVFTSLRRIAIKYDIPIIVYSHVSGDLSYPYDVHQARGNKTFVNETENVFALYSKFAMVDGKKVRRSCVHWLAARFQGQVIHNYYLMSFNPDTLTFDSDCEINMDEFNSLFVNKRKVEVDEAALYAKTQSLEERNRKLREKANQKYAESM